MVESINSKKAYNTTPMDSNWWWSDMKSVIDYQYSPKKSEKSLKYRFLVNFSLISQCCKTWAHRWRMLIKNCRFFLWLFPSESNAQLLFWRSNGSHFTRVFIKVSNGQICDSMVENQFWLDVTTRKYSQWLYQDLLAKFQSNS